MRDSKVIQSFSVSLVKVILFVCIIIIVSSCPLIRVGFGADTTNTANMTEWTKQLGTSSIDEGYGAAVDSSGDIYVTGYTEGDLDGNTNAGGEDIYLTKYNSSGTKQWTKQLGTSADDRGESITVDSSNNIYITGFVTGGLSGNRSAGYRDIFLTRYNSSGTEQWTRQLGTGGTDEGKGVAVDSLNNIYVAGYIGGSLDDKTYAGNFDIFLTKYNSGGIKQWTELLGSWERDEARGVVVASSGYIYVTGYTEGDLDGNTNVGGEDIFLTKYNSSGTKQWTQQLGTSADDRGESITVDSSNNIYITGFVTGGLSGNRSAGYRDIFLTKYNSSGTEQWTRQLGTDRTDEGKGVAVDSSGDIYVTGYTAGDLDGNTNAGGEDIYLTKYNFSGTRQWTKQLGTSEWDEGQGVAVDSLDNIYVTGYAQGDLDGNTNSRWGYQDIFLSKF